jgi:uncharacterized membrane protein YedE/YeeE
MEKLMEVIQNPWPWYVSGPLLGMTVPLLLLSSNKQFGVSSVFRHVGCALNWEKIEYFNYDLKNHIWNFLFIVGLIFSAVFLLQWVEVKQGVLSDAAQLYFNSRSILIEGILPTSRFTWTFGKEILMISFGGLCIGFGSRYANGCTSGHAITGLSLLSLGSLIAVIGFFIGGVLGTFLILDSIL